MNGTIAWAWTSASPRRPPGYSSARLPTLKPLGTPSGRWMRFWHWMTAAQESRCWWPGGWDCPTTALPRQRAARNKHRMRTLLAGCGAQSPAFAEFRTDQNLKEIIALAEEQIGYPCVVKPEELNGSRGVIRADLRCELAAAVRRLSALVGEGQPFLIERYIPGFEVALEGLLDKGRLHLLALFDKPDPLEGPFFEETIYVTPSRLSMDEQASILDAAELAARGLGLQTGPIHAELRLNKDGPWIVEVAGRTIGGLCSRILRFGMEVGGGRSLEQLILRQACGLPLEDLQRESLAGGVMMIPIPEAGLLRSVSGIDEASAVGGIEDVQITAKVEPVAGASARRRRLSGVHFREGCNAGESRKGAPAGSQLPAVRNRPRVCAEGVNGNAICGGLLCRQERPCPRRACPPASSPPASGRPRRRKTLPSVASGTPAIADRRG